MKTLGLCSLVLFLLASLAPAQVLLSAPDQDASRAPILNPDKDTLQKWLAHAGKQRWQFEDVPQSMWSAGGESFCMYMRTYRVKRNGPPPTLSVRPATPSVSPPGDLK